MRIFAQLIRRDLVVFRKKYIGKMIDMLITFVVWVTVFGYLLPLLGMESNYGIFIMVGAIASFGIFDVIGQASEVIFDIQGDRTISYLLLLPLPSFAIFSYMVVSWAIQSALIALPLYLIGKLIFWDTFILGDITWHHLIPAFVTVNLFFGSFALWIIAALPNLRDVTRLYFRFINPLFLLGCYFTPWATYFKISPAIGYLLLLDPLSHVMEIMRASIIGQSGYLPFWLSFCALWVFIFACTAHATRRLRRQLDCL